MRTKSKNNKQKEIEVREVYIPQPDTSKQDAINALVSNGYDAFSEDGVVMVTFEYHDSAKEMTKILKDIEKILKSVGYNRSFGCRAKRSHDG